MDQNDQNTNFNNGLNNQNNETDAAKNILINTMEPTKINPNNIYQQTQATAQATQPITEPALNPTAIPTTSNQPTQNPMHFVLQWITYALWGWTLLVLSFVIFNLVLSIVSDVDMGEAILYPISALFVLLPASIIADVFYGKIETPTKKGGALIIMVIHAVIFILFMVGFLIAAVFSMVSMLLSSGDSTDSLGYMVSSVLVALCYAMLIVRTLKPGFFRKAT